MQIPSECVLGVPLARTDYDGAVAWVLEAAQRAAVTAVEAANTHVVAMARHEPRFGAAMRRFDVLLPDGMPLVWCMNRRLSAGERLRDRVYGPTFMLRCLAATTDGQAGHFLLGGSEELLSALRLSLEKRFPGVRILGVYAPPFGKWSDEENQRIFDQIAASGAKLIWVGLGCPKQEYWISESKQRLPHGVYFGIGAAFAFHAGLVRQAPAWMQNAGLEWLYRICAEPRRLFKRYLVYNSLFLFYLLRGGRQDGERKIGE